MREDIFNNRPVIKSQTLDFVLNIPLVSGLLEHVQQTLKRHPLLLRLIDLGELALIYTLMMFMPLIHLFSSPLKCADNCAVKTLKYAKSVVPFPFELTWNDLYARGKAPIEHVQQVSQNIYENGIKAPAKSIYDQTTKTVSQLQQSDNEYVKRIGATISSIHENMNGMVKEMSEKTSQEVAEGEKKGLSMMENMLGDLDGLQKFASTLPSEAQKRLEPYIEVLSKTYQDISAEAFDSKVPVRERLSKVISYLQNNTVPELQKKVAVTLKSVPQEVEDKARKVQ